MDYTSKSIHIVHLDNHIAIVFNTWTYTNAIKGTVVQSKYYKHMKLVYCRTRRDYLARVVD